MYFNPGQWLFRKTHGSRTAETLRLDPAGSVQALAQRVHQIAAGYEDCNDCDDLRDDMIFKLCAGRAPQTGDSLASQPTMSRLENSVDSKDLYRIGQELVDIFLESYDREPEVIILDCDDTNNNTYGQQEQNLYNHYYRDHCYMPLHIYEGRSGKLITTILKPGRRSKQSDIAAFLKKLIIVRGDSHFTSPDFMVV